MCVIYFNFNQFVSFVLNLYMEVLHIIQIYYGITSGRVLDGEHVYIKILEVN